MVGKLINRAEELHKQLHALYDQALIAAKNGDQGKLIVLDCHGQAIQNEFEEVVQVATSLLASSS